MKKRTVVIVLAAVVAAPVALVCALRLPPSQRWLAHQVAARVPGLELAVEHVSIGLSAAEILGVEARYAGTRVSLPRVVARYSGWALLMRRELTVERLEATDLAIVEGEARTATAPAAGSAQAFGGFLAPLHLPLRTTVEAVCVTGRAELAAGREVRFSLEGHPLMPAGEGATDFQFTVFDPVAKAGAEKRLGGKGRLLLRQSAQGAVERLELAGDVAMPAAVKAAQANGLSFRVVAERDGVDAERLEATVRLPTATAGEPALIGLTMRHRPADGRLEGTWTVNLRREQLAGVVADGVWPDFTAEAGGTFGVATGTGDFSATGRAIFGVSRLQRLRPELAGLGGLTGQVDFAVERAGQVVKLAKLEAELNEGRGRVLRLASLQPASYRLDNNTVAIAAPESDLVQLELAALPVSWLQPLLAGCALEGREIVGAFALTASADGTQLALRSRQPLVVDALTVRRDGRKLLDRARLSLSPRIEHGGKALRLVVPDLSLTTAAGDRLDGSVDVQYDGGAATLGFAAALRGAMPTLLNPFTPVPLGALQLDAEVAGAARADEFALRTARVALRRPGGGAVATVEVQQPLTLNLAAGELGTERPGEPALRAELGGLPLAWVQPFLPEAILGGSLDSGELRLRGAGRAWVVETARPIVFSGVRYGRGGQVAFDGLGGELRLGAAAKDGGWAIDSLGLKLRRTGEPAFGDLAVSLVGKESAEGKGRILVPVTLDNEGRSTRFQFEAEWARGEAGIAATAKLEGDTIHLRDLGALVALRPPAPPAKAGGGAAKDRAPAGGATAKDAKAFWAGLSGRVEIGVKKLVLEGDEIADLQAVAVCDEGRVELEKFAGRGKHAVLAAKFAVTFDGVQAQPYALAGEFTLPGLDAGAWLRAAAAGEDPMLETVLEIGAKMEGRGRNLDDLVDGVRGEFKLKGGPGVLRIKDRRVETASALGGLVLGLLSKNREKPAAALTAGSQLLDELREFRFESFDAVLSRGADLNLKFSTIDLRSAEKRLTGTGTATHVAGRSLAEYPLRLDLRLAGKENFAALLDGARLLDGTKDDLGYYQVRQSLPVAGTMTKLDWNKMLMIIGAGALAK